MFPKVHYFKKKHLTLKEIVHILEKNTRKSMKKKKIKKLLKKGYMLVSPAEATMIEKYKALMRERSKLLDEKLLDAIERNPLKFTPEFFERKSKEFIESYKGKKS